MARYSFDLGIGAPHGAARWCNPPSPRARWCRLPISWNPSIAWRQTWSPILRRCSVRFVAVTIVRLSEKASGQILGAPGPAMRPASPQAKGDDHGWARPTTNALRRC